MNKYNFAISIIVILMILDFFIMGYCLGLLDYFKIGTQPRNVSAVTTGTTNSTARTPPQQPPPTQPESQQTPQEQPTPEVKQQEQQPEENNDTISEAEAIKLVEQMYQNDGHVVVMGQNSDSFDIGCFMEMYYDEDTNEPRYNMQTAEYKVNKQTGEVTELKNDLKTQQPADTETSENKVYTREEINAMINIDYVDGCGLYQQSELNDIIQDQKIDGENCYIGNAVWNNGNTTRNFYVGSQSLNVYNESGDFVGKVTDDFVSSLE